jgi:hypothetical protein
VRRGLLLCVSAASALAWNWDSVEAPNGDDLTYHICDGNFTAAEEDEIDFAANSWDAGAGEAMRGAIWNFIRGSDNAAGTCGPDDNDDEVYMRSLTWFNNNGIGAFIAFCWNDDNDIDLLFRSDQSWVTTVPSSTAPGSLSIGQTALHEWGHALGFNHESTVIATMNPSYPNGGDISAHKYRPHEDDYAGLVANRPDSSTGRNLMLGRYYLSGGEQWDSKTASWTVCDEIVSDPDGPEEIFAIIHGTASQSPWVEWWLSADTDCDNGTRYDVGSRQPTIGSGTPYLIHPNPYDFRGVPAGDYYLCAEIDPDDLISETNTSDSDNDLRSEVTVTVQDCP